MRVQPTLFDAKALKLPLLEKPLHHYKGDDHPPAWLADLGAQFAAADAFIIVDGEYNHSPTPSMMNLLDHFYLDQYKFKASATARSQAKTRGLCGDRSRC